MAKNRYEDARELIRNLLLDSDFKTVDDAIAESRKVGVTGVTLSPTTASVEIGGTVQLSATVSPENATNKKVNWTSGDTTTATVSDSGLVTTLAEGTVSITATSEDNAEAKATCTVTVTTPTATV